MKNFKIIITALIPMMILSGCNYLNSNDVTIESNKNIDQTVENEQEIKEEDSIDKSKEKFDKGEIDLSLNPNENGEIMILMYHGISDEESTWERSHENFREDLQVLYDKGYRPISLEDYINNNIETEEGYTPIVLTFDDGRQNNFNIIEENGKKIVDPNSAVGILEEFHKEHPDFPLEATFFINGTQPFGQSDLIEYKLEYIVDKGMDIGNHTINHNDMSIVENQDPEKIQEYIGKEVQFINSIIPEYDVNTYALCNGSRPREELEKYLEKGFYEDVEYKNIAILNVGWRPNVSPIDKEFNPLSIHRVRASEINVDGVGVYDWIEGYENNPSKRFISDGKRDIITIPKDEEVYIDEERLNGKELYVYE